MSTPRPKYFCPRCRAAFDVDSNYCGRCGADMHRASRLQHAALLDEDLAIAATANPDDPPRLIRPRTAQGHDREGAQPQRVAAPRERRASVTQDQWLGRVVDGRYRVMDIIGRGGMGVVYKVEHQRMGKIAAMKVLHRDLAGDREVIGRFQREAEAVSRLTHPNTVQVFDFGTAQGAMYLVMEYVRGLDVGSLIDRDGPMSFERAAPLFDQVCAALSEAHELGIVHRDLKPENILVTRTHGGQDFVKVLDFGLAKLAEREESSSVTGRGSIVGTPYYMSPEQIRGDDEVDARSDIYSLGALMYRVLTGQHVFNATSPVGVLTKHLTEPVVLPSQRASHLDIPPEVDEIVLRALRKVPAERYQSAHELEEALNAAYGELYEHTASGRRPLAWRGGSSSAAVTARSLSTALDDEVDGERRLRRADLDAFERSIKRRRWVGFVTVPLLLAAAGGGGYGYLTWRAQQPHTEEEESNDVLGDATLIGSGRPVTGTLGRRMSASRGDHDYFRLRETPSGGARDELTAEVTALPNIDISLSMVDASGRVLAQRDEGGMGDPERLRGIRVRGGVVLMVTEARSASGLPTENVSDSYRLTATLSPVSAGSESEPDDSATDAISIAPGAKVTGWLDRRADVDSYRFDGSAGRYTVSVGGAINVPVVLRHREAEVTARETVLELAQGEIIELSRGDRALPPGQPLPGIDDGYTLSIEPAP